MLNSRDCDDSLMQHGMKHDYENLIPTQYNEGREGRVDEFSRNGGNSFSWRNAFFRLCAANIRGLT
ncbi:MAG: hypothetical protein NPIRA05_09140 [Nitrospirales bacterium]|nr:MAG: hypothetical protein NPIRA05_09140 [Nitrospirales bacterium]